MVKKMENKSLILQADSPTVHSKHAVQNGKDNLQNWKKRYDLKPGTDLSKPTTKFKGPVEWSGYVLKNTSRFKRKFQT